VKTGDKQRELLPDLFFNLEDGGDIFLRNLVLLSTDYMVLYPSR
jgi:hypothetical protein